MKQTRFWIRKFHRRAVQQISSHFYVNPDPDPRRSVLIAGTARSGTTWLGDLIASQIPSRILFEPFNPDLVQEYSSFHYFQYLRPNTENAEFQNFAEQVFTGSIRNRWIDRQNERIHAEYRIIKEIRINLALKWLHDHFPQVPILFLMRHPCAVVSSRIELGWDTDRDIKPFLSQPDLVEDHLWPHMDMIANARTAEEKHAVIWCVSNLIPLKQFEGSGLRTIYYESLCTQPKEELRAVFATIGQQYQDLAMAAVDYPSQTSRLSSDVVTGKDRISSWRRKLTTAQIERILSIVDGFGLGHLYGEALLPHSI